MTMTFSGNLRLLLAATALLAMGCSGGTEVRVVGDASSNSTGNDGTTGTTGTTSTDGTTGTTGTDGTTSTDGTTGTTGTDGTSSSDSTDSSDGTDGTDSSDGTDDPNLAQVCGVELDSGKGIGEACTEHSECSTGYCYDEYLWNEDGNIVNRFCTVACTGCTLKGNCNEWPKYAGASQGENKCIPFTSSFVNHYSDMRFESLCLLSCQSDADCPSGMPKCDSLTFGKDYNYGVHKICQPTSFVKLDESEF